MAINGLVSSIGQGGGFSSQEPAPSPRDPRQQLPGAGVPLTNPAVQQVLPGQGQANPGPVASPVPIGQGIQVGPGAGGVQGFMQQRFPNFPGLQGQWSQNQAARQANQDSRLGQAPVQTAPVQPAPTPQAPAQSPLPQGQDIRSFLAQKFPAFARWQDWGSRQNQPQAPVSRPVPPVGGPSFPAPSQGGGVSLPGQPVAGVLGRLLGR